MAPNSSGGLSSVLGNGATPSSGGVSFRGRDIQEGEESGGGGIVMPFGRPLYHDERGSGQLNGADVKRLHSEAGQSRDPNSFPPNSMSHRA